jgi:hypothetical protein
MTGKEVLRYGRLLHYDPQMANERSLLFYGQLNEQGNELAFTPSRVVIPQ